MTQIQQRPNKRYGWLPDLPDNRDLQFASRVRAPRKLPAKVDLRTTGFEPPIYDQGYLGSCTANAIAGAFEYEQRRQGLVDYTPSRLFIYYEERKVINATGYDSGAFIRDGLKVVNKFGAPHESLWTYDVNRFTIQPSQDVYADGLKHQTTAYMAVDNRSQYQVKTPLAMGIPVIWGFTVYPWFENVTSSGVCIPQDGQPVLGGHAVEFVGYEKLPITRKVYGIGRNSWGTSWGDQGYFYIPLSWACDYNNADDFWVIQQVEA